MKRALIIFLILLLIFGGVAFAAPGELTTFITIWSGAKPITDSLSLKSASEQVSTLKTATDTVMIKQTYPYSVLTASETGTTFKIIKYRCDTKMQICGYWIEATRGGKTVATNSPVWISPPPIVALVSDMYDAKTDTQTITVKEDPKMAVEQILQAYVDRQPLGKPVTGTKE